MWFRGLVACYLLLATSRVRARIQFANDCAGRAENTAIIPCVEKIAGEDIVLQ